jgi:hypothetical protein
MAGYQSPKISSAEGPGAAAISTNSFTQAPGSQLGSHKNLTPIHTDEHRLTTMRERIGSIGVDRC